ncbi:MAG: DEAD/DEAH box helicase [Candidatus Nanoarchaeia archaeon]|nr:DEAD/DEAH box helicase [Candidatus Nanoarchaeia archaeon]
MINLLPWQKEAFDNLKLNNFNGILKVGTGKGKTVFAIYIMNYLNKIIDNFKVCIIVPTINLMNQWQDELIKLSDFKKEDIGFYYGSMKDTNKKIMIFVVNSASINDNLKELHKNNPFNFLVADECHHYGAPLFSKFIDINISYKLGLSATPERENDKEGTEKIVNNIGKIFYELNHIDDLNAIPKFNIWSILVNLTNEEDEEYTENSLKICKLNNTILSKHGISIEDKDFSEKIKKLAEKKDSLVLGLLKLWNAQARIKYNAENKLPLTLELVKMSKGEKIIIFNERISYTEKINKELREAGFTTFIVHSNLSKSEVIETLKAFKQSKEGVLVAPKMIDEGYDVPDASTAIIVSYTNSARQLIQRSGRILRKKEGKEYANCYILTVKGIEEKKYYNLLHCSKSALFALNGEWLSFDVKTLTFNSAPEFRKDFFNYINDNKQRIDEFKQWVTKKLDDFELSLQGYFIDKLPERLNFFTKYLDVIEELSENKQKWPLLNKKLKMTVPEKTIKVNKKLDEEEKRVLLNLLRNINTRIGLPGKTFTMLYDFITGNQVIYDKASLDFLIELCSGTRYDVWPEELFNFIKDEFLPSIRDKM